MYWVKGSAIIGAARTSASDNGVRRQALGLRAPLRKALAATRASAARVMPWSCM